MADTKGTQRILYNTSETASDTDAHELAAIGKKSVLRVSYNLPLIHIH
jgi:hypothetical protein